MVKTACFRAVALLALVVLAACSSAPPAPPSADARLKAFDRAVQEFADRFTASKAIETFSRHFRDTKPTIEIARSRGLSTFEERLLRHQLIRALLAHDDRLSLVIGPGRTRLSTSQERYYMVRHGQINQAVSIPGHVMPANFVIFSSAGRDPLGHNWIWLTAVRLDNNQIVYEKAVPFAASYTAQKSFPRHRSPYDQHVSFKVISDLPKPVAVWLNPTFPTLGPDDSGPVPPGIPPVATIMPGQSTIVGVFKGYRRGNVFLCIQGALYRNLCKKYYVPYDDGEGTPFEITGTDPYGFILARLIPAD
ncbi:MAG: hypothetical protein M0041_05730 [Nitrospiraceae bacterium]|nr:hypothetical protein [Nitrospiraceae bacterium]